MIGLQLQDALGILETLLVLLALVQLLHNETDTKHHHQRESAQPHPMVALALSPGARSDTHDDLLAHGLLRQRQLLLRLLARLTHLSRYLSLTRSQPSRTHHRCANNQNTTRECVCVDRSLLLLRRGQNAKETKPDAQASFLGYSLRVTCPRYDAYSGAFSEDDTPAPPRARNPESGCE